MSLRVNELIRSFRAEGAANLPGALPSLKDLFPLADGEQPVIGIFHSSGDPTAAEILAGTGFDYLLIDGEHSPLSLETIQSVLRAVAAYPTLGMVRVSANDEVLIKQYLDLGVQTLVVPMVDSVEEAQAAARAVAYPPQGVRGVGSALARSGRWNRIPDYLARARETITLIVQAESADSVANIREIAAVEGVDGVFIGPSDLAASMGLLGQQTHPDVVAAVKHVITEVKAAGKFVGVNAFAQDQARDYLTAGADFVNVGADVALLANGSRALLEAFQG